MGSYKPNFEMEYKNEENRLTELGYKIFSDRYANKDIKRETFKLDDMVVYRPDNSTQREIGWIYGLYDQDGNYTEVPSELYYVDVGDNPTCRSEIGTTIRLHKDQVDKLLETSPEQMLDRMAKGISTVEKEPEVWEPQFRELLDGYKFVPGGRICTMLGTEQQLTAYNCFSRDTMVYIDGGLFPIGFISGIHKVFSGDGKLRSAIFKSYGFQNLFEIELSNSLKIKATENHEWIVNNPNGKKIKLKTFELLNKLIPCNIYPQAIENGEYLDGVKHGIIFGDGTKSSRKNKCHLKLFGNKMAYANDIFSSHKSKFYDRKNNYPEHIHVSNIDEKNKQLPQSISPSYWKGFIVGLIGTDGHVDKSEGLVMLHNKDENILKEIVKNCQGTGFIPLNIRITRKYSPYNGEYSPMFKLSFAKASFSSSNFINKQHKENFELHANNKFKNPSIKVVSVKNLNTTEEVFCCEEPEKHTFTIGHGYLTGNCFILPCPEDSREGIFAMLQKKAECMSRGGGVGINISSLRPRNAYIKGVNGRSSGAVSWGELYSFITGLIEQGGSRRGASLLMLNDWHPDIEEFILVKRNMSRITNSNISVGLSDKFMEAVKADEDWHLKFPDTTHEEYKNWNGIIEKYNGPTIVYKTVKAKYLWNLIIESAWTCAEPGLWFRDRANNDSNSYYYDNGYLVSVNPCGEISNPGDSVCLLGHINLSKFFNTRSVDVDWTALENAIRLAVRFLDNVIDYTPYFDKKIEMQQKGERRIGLGTLGLAELLIKLGIRYGSKESVDFCDTLYKFIRDNAYYSSVDLAEEKGAFPYFNDKVLESGFCKRLSNNLKKEITLKGLRNVVCLTQAPCGSTATMVNTSTGIEPFYAWEFWRTSRLGRYQEKVKIYQAYIGDINNLPDYFVTAMELTPEEHVDMQGVIQKYVDQSISKTCNVPESYTIEQIGDIYRYMYDRGCKGGTVYRDNSRNFQVLNTKEDTANFAEALEGVSSTKPSKLSPPSPMQSKHQPIIKYTPLKENPLVRSGNTLSIETAAGTLHVTMNEIDGEPGEVFLTLGKGGSDINAMAEAMGRLCSVILRLDPRATAQERVHIIVDQLEGIGGARTYGFGPTQVSSLPDAFSKALAQNWGNGPEYTNIKVEEVKTINVNGAYLDLCPECGNITLVRIDGCKTCTSCGHSEC